VISIDTNLLLRYLLQDDEIQSSKANLILSGNKQILITDVVLVEMIWTLKGKKYSLSMEQIVNVVEQLFKEPNLIFENGQTVWRALNIYRNTTPVRVSGKNKDVDFPDALIVEKSKYVASNKNETFGGLYTFDKAAQQIIGTVEP
jgi:predicted nucleic-acid-binding protein